MTCHAGKFSRRGKKARVRFYRCRLFFNHKESDMEIRTLSDRDLLTLLIGEKTTMQRYRGRLLPLALGEADCEPHPKLVAAMELALRLLREKIQHAPALESPQLVRDYLALHFMGRQRESFLVIFLDARNRVIAAEEMFTGTLTQTSVYPREIVRAALRHNAAACIFGHNHPSGVAEPSHADELLTATLKRALALVDVRVLDHFVVGVDSMMSFAESGLL
jgi:DNA repair protein RadC